MPLLAETLYRGGLTLLAPVIPFYLRRRVGQGKEIESRLRERYGFASQPRPAGRLVWIHGASVGESMSALPMVKRLCELNPDITILFTTGTLASAELLGKKQLPGVIHQFVPLDVPAYAQRFMAHWQPDAAIWIESELWPTLLAEMARRNTPALRINARLTEKSAAGWRRLTHWLQHMLGAFSLTLALSPDDAARLKQAGAGNVQFTGNLKFTAPPPEYDAAALATLQSAIGKRPVWLMASSHEGEEAMALRVHAALSQEWPDLLTIIAPRHPRRADEVEALIQLPHARRSRNQALLPEHAVYLADTMGEMGMLYRAAGLVVMGGSFTPKGGHNPIEPAQCGAATLIGPDTTKCSDVVAELVHANALQQVHNEAELTQALATLLRDETRRNHMQTAGLEATQQQQRIMSATLQAMAQVLGQLGVRTA